MAEMRYAHQSDVTALLKIKESDPDLIDRVIRLENGLSEVFDERCGRSFGVQPSPPESRVIVATGGQYLLLPLGIYEVTQIQYLDHQNQWTPFDPEHLFYVPWARGLDGAYQSILLPSARWSEGQAIEITGYWADQDYEAIPDDVTQAMTFITVRQYRRQTASPTETIGPDGLYVPAPHAWDDPMVKGAIRRHRVRRRRVGV